MAVADATPKLPSRFIVSENIIPPKFSNRESGSVSVSRSPIPSASFRYPALPTSTSYNPFADVPTRARFRRPAPIGFGKYL